VEIDKDGYKPGKINVIPNWFILIMQHQHKFTMMC
jgi:hypothetical protein